MCILLFFFQVNQVHFSRATITDHLTVYSLPKPGTDICDNHVHSVQNTGNMVYSFLIQYEEVSVDIDHNSPT